MCKFFRLSKNKTMEFDFSIGDCCSWFDFTSRWSRKTDHAGFYLGLSIFDFSFSFAIIDNRHWNDDENCWEECNVKM